MNNTTTTAPPYTDQYGHVQSMATSANGQADNSTVAGNEPPFTVDIGALCEQLIDYRKFTIIADESTALTWDECRSRVHAAYNVYVARTRHVMDARIAEYINVEQERCDELTRQANHYRDMLLFRLVRPHEHTLYVLVSNVVVRLKKNDSC
jgi:hypothetical protein